MAEEKIQLLSCANLKPGEHIEPLEENISSYLGQADADLLQICAAGDVQKAVDPKKKYYVLKSGQTKAYDLVSDCPQNTQPNHVLTRSSSVMVKKPDAEKPSAVEHQINLDLNPLSLQLLYNQGVFFSPVLGNNPLSNPKNICKVSEEGETKGQLHISDKLADSILDSVDPKNQAIELPANYPGSQGFQDAVKNEASRSALSLPAQKNKKTAFWSRYHALQDLNPQDAALLRQLLGAAKNSASQKEWLEPVEALRPDNKRNYVISTKALHYCGAYVIQELRRIGDSFYGRVDGKRAHDLATRLEVMISKQSQVASNMIAKTISLDLKALEPALIKFFGDKNILSKIRNLPPTKKSKTNATDKVLHPVLSPDFDRTAYAGINGFIFIDEMKLLYALHTFKKGVASVPAYTWSDLVGRAPKSNTSEYHFVCETGGDNDEAALCNRRRHTALEVEIEFLQKLLALNEDPAMNIRLQELIAMDQEIEAKVLAHSSANSTKHGFWGGALPFVGLGALVSIGAYFLGRKGRVSPEQIQKMIDEAVKRAQKAAAGEGANQANSKTPAKKVAVGEGSEKPKDTDDTGAAGEADSGGEEPVVVGEKPSGEGAEYSTRPVVNPGVNWEAGLETLGWGVATIGAGLLTGVLGAGTTVAAACPADGPVGEYVLGGFTVKSAAMTAGAATATAGSLMMFINSFFD